MITMNEATGTNEEAGEIIETGDLKEVNMILGDRERVRQAGIIRPGIKIPVSTATKEQKALYEKLNGEGVDFDTIDAEMLKLVKSTARSILRPVNIDYFIARDSDFKRPSDAEFIRSNYADADGKIRRLPIWFPCNDITTSIPHNFVAFDGAHNSRCYSFYDGDQLKFKYLPKEIKGPGNPTDWKILDSDDEDEATKVCGYKVSFGGRYHFYVPGVKSVGDIILPTGSWYGLGDAVAVLRRIRSVLGRYNNLYQGKPFLELVKVKQKVKTPDGKKQDQWVVTIETSVDMMELASYAENRVGRGFAGIQLLNGGQGKTAEPKTILESASVQTVAAKPSTAADTTAAKKETPAPSDEPKTGQAEEVISIPEPTEIQKAVEALKELAKQNDLTEEELGAYATFKLRKPLADEDDFGRIQRLYTELRTRLQSDKVAIKSRCQELLKEAKQSDPEVEGMLTEFNRLAENHEIPVEHMRAHLTALTGGKSPESMPLAALQGAYKEVEARLKRGNVEQFKAEVAGNYNELKKAA